MSTAKFVGVAISDVVQTESGETGSVGLIISVDVSWSQVVHVAGGGWLGFAGEPISPAYDEMLNARLKMVAARISFRDFILYS